MGITAETFLPLRKQALEEFVYQLLRAERSERFLPGTVQVDGPSDDGVRDGGRDVRVVIRAAPHRPVDDALLPDDQDEIWFSCKSKNDPESPREGWMDIVRKQVDPGKAWDLYREGKLEAARRKAEANPNPGLYRMLAEGGQYRVVLNWRPGQIAEFQRELIERLAFRVRLFSSAEISLESRIRIFDASDLAAATQRLFDELPSEVLDLLVLDDPPFWERWPDWTVKFEADRRAMEFRVDSERQGLVDKLHAFLLEDQQQKIIHIWGPPGVGKTRLVHEVLREANVQERVRFTQDRAALEDWLRQSSTKIASDLVLVVDELAVHGLQQSLFRPFEIATAGTPQARLIAIGPLEKPYQGRPAPEEVKPLDDSIIREILAGEMATNDERVDRVLHLCEGYPLFALWLGKELGKNPELLAEPGNHLTGQTDPWQATAAVLGGSLREAELRGKALLLVVLAPEKWHKLSEYEQQGLAKGLRANWNDLHDAADKCTKRGLLRTIADGRRYISPANLERLILNHFFGPDGPLDPEELAARVGARFARLQQRAHEVEASESCKRRLAGAGLQHLLGLARAGHSDRAMLQIAILRCASEADPERASEVLHQIVELLGPQTIAERPHLLWGITSSLVHVARCPISAVAFAAVEGALFQFAEHTPLHNWPIDTQRSWAGLFAAVHHSTHRPFEERFEILRARLHAGPTSARARAVEGLGSATHVGTSFCVDSGFDDVSSPDDVEASAPDYEARLELAWSELVEIARDQHKEVADAGRRVIIERISAGIQRGLTPVQILTLGEDVHAWTLDQRNALRATAAARALGEALRPQDLVGELSVHVGRWHIDSERRVAEHDRELAARLIDQPGVLDEAIEWLQLDTAVRRRPFARALGRVDRSMACLPALIERAGDAAIDEMITNYLLGWGEQVGDDAFDDWLEAHANGQLAVHILAQTLILADGNDRRASLLLRLMREPGFPPRALLGLGSHRSWGEKVELGLVDQLICTVAALGPEAASAALWLVAGRLRQNLQLGDVAPAIYAILDQSAKQQLPSITSIAWKNSVVALAKSGELRPLSNALLWSTSDEYTGFPRAVGEVLGQLAEDQEPLEFWPLLASVMQTRSSARKLAFILDYIFEGARARLVDPDVIMEWVGADRSRAEFAALLTWPFHGTLDPLARRLVTRFGAQSDVAREIRIRASSMPEGVPLVDDFAPIQAARARGWAEGAEPEVRIWAHQLADTLEREVWRQRENEKYERRYG
jgi:hypothetical protein